MNQIYIPKGGQQHSPCNDAEVSHLNPGLLDLPLCSFLVTAAFWILPHTAHAQLYVGSGNIVGEYDPGTGTPINASFITGLSGTAALQLSGNVLFVADGGNNTIGEYDAMTGSPIDANFITTGVNAPYALALSGNNLFVAEGNVVAEYNATSGATMTLNFTRSGSGTALNDPYALAISGNNLFEANTGTGTVGEYDATTGAPINANFIINGLSNPLGLALSGSNLFVANEGGNTVGEYNATTGGTAINGNFITGLNFPENLAISGNNLFVSNNSSTTVGEYDATTGAAIKPSLTGLNGKISIAVGPVPEPSTAVSMALGAFALLGFHRGRRDRFLLAPDR